MEQKEILAIFCQKMKEELHDILDDDELHSKLLEAGMVREAALLEEIASEEFTHAKTYRRILARHGHAISQEAHDLWDRVYEIYHMEDK